MPTLLALFGSKQGLRLPLEADLVVGRSSGADVQLIDAKASREHCRFVVTPDHVAVEDLGSQNGTFVNGEAIQGRTALTAGDEIAVGDSLFVLDPDVDVMSAKYGEATVCLTASERPPDAVRARSGQESPSSSSSPVALMRVEALARQLATAATPEQAAEAVLAAVVEAFVPDRAFVLADDGAGTVRPVSGKSRAAVVAISRTALDLVRRERRALLLDDAISDRELHKARSVLRHGLRSVMVAPVLVGAELRGFLHLDRDGPGAYGPGDLELLNALAAVAALALAAPSGAQVAAAPPGTGEADDETGGRLVGEAPAFREALRLMAAAARVDSPVLITGESGTGKEELARALHGRSRRAGRPFVAVNCGAIPEALAESALFGHQKGAFTGATQTQEGYFEAADGGTLFLDEIGELAPAVQAKLLRALQERLFFRLGSTSPRRADVRVVAATHRDLDKEIAAGRFREDLYFRLNVLRIALPPLRDRPGDLPALAAALLARIAARLGRRCPALDPGAVAALARWRWPGNARELGNVLERLLVLREPDEPAPVDAAEVDAALGRDPPAPAGARSESAEDAPLAEKIAQLERREIEAALRRARGVKSHAARVLGLSRPTLDKKIAELGIDLWAAPKGGAGE